MPSRKLVLPDDAIAQLARRFGNQHRNWLARQEQGNWPLTFPLGDPLERDMVEDAAGIRAWVTAWADWRGAGTVAWTQKKWGRFGEQRLPESIGFSTPGEVARAVGQEARWERAVSRYGRLCARWHVWADTGVLAREFDVLADYSEEDFSRLAALFEWLDRNPSSSLYLRQLPIEGLDTKWVEARKRLVIDLLRPLRPGLSEADFHDLCGLRRAPHRLRIRILCPALRRALQGLGDIEAPVADLAALPLVAKTAIIVENLETGLALPDIPGAVALMKLGHGVGIIEDLPWLRLAAGVYWGDIDTHGFAILSRARRALPGLRSALMDEPTLLSHRELWGHEPSQFSGPDLDNLNADERAVYTGLRSQRWGPNVRLEQERIAWPEAVDTLNRLSATS